MKTKNEIGSTSIHYTVEPEYLKSFKCIGEQCSDSCCFGWNVTLDKKTFKNYRRSTSFALKRLFDEKIVANRSSQRSEFNFAKIKMNPSGECPFLEQKLCAIQKLEGASMLSDTCAQYPRNRLNAGDLSQTYLTPSCPEASRLILSSPSAMTLEISSKEVYSADQVPRNGPWGLGSDAVNLFHFTALNIVTAQEYPLWKRLAALGTMCWLVDQEVKKKTVHEAEKIIFSLGSDENAIRMFIEGLSSPERNISGQVQIFSRVWKLKGASRKLHSSLQQKVMDEVSAILFENGLPADDVALQKKYHHGLVLLGNFNLKEPHFVSNYILNDMGRSRFPFSAGAISETPWRAFLYLISRYGVLRFMLAARAAQLGPLFEGRDFIETVSVFSRKFEHDSTFSKTILTCFQSANFTDKYFSILKLIRDDFAENMLFSQSFSMDPE